MRLVCDYDLTTLPSGAVHADIFNAHSGLSMLSRNFRGPFKAIRANWWATRYCRLIDFKVPHSDPWTAA